MSERTGHFMETFTGRRFYLTDPRVEDLCIEDIAHHLARICRYNGAINNEHYSVAEHSCLMAKWVLENLPESPIRISLAMVALFHDAAEAYTGDIIYPLKRILGDPLRSLENGIARKIFEKFLGADAVPIGEVNALLLRIKDLDLRIRVDEWKALKYSPTNPLVEIEEKGLPPLGVEILSLSPNDAEQWFLDFYAELTRTPITHHAPVPRRGRRNQLNWEQSRRTIVTVKLTGDDPKVAGIVESVENVEDPDAIRFKPGKPVIPAGQFSIGYDVCKHAELGPHESGEKGLFRCTRCGVGGTLQDMPGAPGLGVIFASDKGEYRIVEASGPRPTSGKIHPPECKHSNVDGIQGEARRCNDCGASLPSPTSPAASQPVVASIGGDAPGIPMQIVCPGCYHWHIDKGEFATKPHHTHACQNPDCGLVWRPALVNTVGVRCLPGFLNGKEEK